MRKLLTVLFSFAALVAANENYNGWLDTCIVSDTLDSAEVKYTKAFNLSKYENCRLLVLADDSATAKLGADSINFHYGYQTGTRCLDSAGVLDTAWDDRVVLDTMVADSFGTSNISTGGADGSLTRVWNQSADTLSVAGYATQSRWFVPEWDGLIRYWVEGLGTLQAEAKPIELILQHNRRIGQAGIEH